MTVWMTLDSCPHSTWAHAPISTLWKISGRRTFRLSTYFHFANTALWILVHKEKIYLGYHEGVCRYSMRPRQLQARLAHHLHFMRSWMKCSAIHFNFNFCVRWKSSSVECRSRFQTLVTLKDIKIACSYHAKYGRHPKSKCGHRSLLSKDILTTSSGIFHCYSLSLWNMRVWEATKGTHLNGNVLWLMYMPNER